MVLEVGGINFRQDDSEHNSLQVRIDEKILSDKIEFVSKNLLRIRPPNLPTEGIQHLYVSNNYGISWQRGSSFVSLKYHLPPQVSFADIDKIQVP